MSRIVDRLVPLVLCGVLLLGTGCVLGVPNWRALYEARLGQPIWDMNEAVLNSAYQDAQGNLTRLSWVTLADGSTVLLGLPAFQKPPHRVVERTVVVTQPEWQQLCQDAIGRQVYGWTWNATTGAVGNSFQIYPSTTPPSHGEAVVQIPGRGRPYCEFVFLPEGWVLQVIEHQGVVKPPS